MKKIVKVLATLMVLMTLVGCSSKKEETVTYVLDQGGITMELTLYHVGDKVVKQTSDNTMLFSSVAGLMDVDTIISTCEEYKVELDKITGVTYSFEVDDEKLVETIAIDYNEIKSEDLSKLPLILTEGNIENGISLKKTVELLEQSGFKQK